MINKEHMEAWVAALESGDYEQCRGALRRINWIEDQTTYCTLDILVDVASKDTGRDLWRSATPSHSALRWLAGDNTCVVTLPDDEGYQSAVVHLNDNRGKTFPELAQMLRKEYL